MVINRNEIEECIEKTKEYGLIFNNKNVYIKSIITYHGEEKYTNYNPYFITDFQYGPGYIYIYGNGRDRIIIDMKTIETITLTNNNSLTILSSVDGFKHEFNMEIV